MREAGPELIGPALMAFTSRARGPRPAPACHPVSQRVW
ncbi:uncharacterized protein SOCE26_012380 [Sorangium cellulosum]|uniref:Uncharacterized protein n=1 Tax=Sorangium cellulosum TaxID=56 RepID=A0A2L0EKL9_SORCE|nr:uncharacterized protein SOCE26_012380 [Sorangium cellulosum]